jgi:phytol kinase
MFPWLFHEPWPVVVLGVIATGVLLGLKYIPRLRNSIGRALHDVDRASFGDLYFTIAVVMVFLSSKGDPIQFCVPMIILTFADSIGALIGVRYGQTPFTTLSRVKSAEGSVMFFLTCFMAAHIPLLLFTDLGKLSSSLLIWGKRKHS